MQERELVATGRPPLPPPIHPFDDLDRAGQVVGGDEDVGVAGLRQATSS